MENGEFGRVIRSLRAVLSKVTWLLWSALKLAELLQKLTNGLPNSVDPQRKAETVKVNEGPESTNE